MKHVTYFDQDVLTEPKERDERVEDKATRRKGESHFDLAKWIPILRGGVMAFANNFPTSYETLVKSMLLHFTLFDGVRVLGGLDGAFWHLLILPRVRVRQGSSLGHVW